MKHNGIKDLHIPTYLSKVVTMIQPRAAIRPDFPDLFYIGKCGSGPKGRHFLCTEETRLSESIMKINFG